MPKLSIKLVLPLFQLSLAVLLLAWGHHVKGPVGLDTLYVPTVTLICMGINAPCILIKPLLFLVTGIRANHPPLDIFGFGLDEILFLVAVFGLWYLVAKWFVAFRGWKDGRSGRLPISSLVWHLAVTAVGAILFICGVMLLLSSGRWDNPVGNIAQGALTLVWALALLIVSLRNVFGVRHPRDVNA
jgi:hypothetical protein